MPLKRERQRGSHWTNPEPDARRRTHEREGRRGTDRVLTAWDGDITHGQMGPAKTEPRLKSPGAPRSEKANRGDTMAEGVCLSHLGFRSLLHSPAGSTLTQALKRTFD
jgi:hypothetical protein